MNMFRISREEGGFERVLVVLAVGAGNFGLLGLLAGALFGREGVEQFLLFCPFPGAISLAVALKMVPEPIE
jgi:hypothetical protein